MLNFFILKNKCRKEAFIVSMYGFLHECAQPVRRCIGEIYVFSLDLSTGFALIRDWNDKGEWTIFEDRDVVVGVRFARSVYSSTLCNV